MKKSIKTIGFLAAAVLATVVTSCSNTVKPDSYGWYHDYDAAKQAAQKKGENILFFISADDSDTESASLKSAVFNTDDFKNLAADKYILCNLDFSQAEYNKGKVDPSSSGKQKKAAQAASDKFQNNLKIATIYNVNGTPSIFLITKDGYVITKIEYDKNVTASKDFMNSIDKQQETIDKVAGLVNAVETTEGIDHVKAIDTMYEATEPQYRYLLSDMIREIPTLDEKNESGLLGKYTFEVANADVMDAYLAKQPAKAVDIYVAAAASGKMDPSYEQQAYYMAGYLLGSSGSTDYDKIIEYLQAACDADPKSESVSSITSLIDVVKEMKTAAAASDNGSSDQTTEPADSDTEAK